MTTFSAQAACDATIAHAVKARPAPAHPNLVLLTTILASSLAFVDGSVVNVGLPAIGRDLHAQAGDLQWLINAYLLPLSALLLLGGALGDRFGQGRMLVIGVSVFALASGLCAAAPSLGLLLAARAVQGVGAALLMPCSLAILGGAFSGESRGKAVGTWAAAGSVTGAVAPLLGGWLIDGFGWRWIFLINLPLAAGAVALAVAFAPREAREAHPAPLDISGAALVTTALGALTWALTLGSGAAGWTPTALAMLALGVGASGAFILVEKRKGDGAMAPLALFGSRMFVGLSLLTLLLYGALSGLMVLLPYVLIQSAGYSATAAGAALLPFPIVVAVSSPLMGALAGRIGARLPLTIGPLIVAVGLLLALRVGQGGSYWTTVLPAMLVISFGMAFAIAPLTTAVLASVDVRHTGSASGLNSATARIGGLVATALLGLVLSARGAALIGDFRVAAIVGAAAAAAAGACAFLLIEASDHPHQ